MKKAIAAGIVVVACFAVCANAIVVKPRGRALRQIVAEKSPDKNIYIGATTHYTGLWDRKFRPKKSYYKVQQILEGLPDPVFK